MDGECWPSPRPDCCYSSSDLTFPRQAAATGRQSASITNGFSLTTSPRFGQGNSDPRLGSGSCYHNGQCGQSPLPERSRQRVTGSARRASSPLPLDKGGRPLGRGDGTPGPLACRKHPTTARAGCPVLPNR